MRLVRGEAAPRAPLATAGTCSHATLGQGHSHFSWGSPGRVLVASALRECGPGGKLTCSCLQLQDWDTINIDWFTNKREEEIALPEFKLNFLWSENDIAVSVDQIYSRVGDGGLKAICCYRGWARREWKGLEARAWSM